LLVSGSAMAVEIYNLCDVETTEYTGVPSKVHTVQLVKIQPDERLATISELNPIPSLVTS